MFLEIRHLEAVQRLGSVTQAAAALHLTQPAVSHALREIERRLAAEVVTRHGLGIRVAPQLREGSLRAVPLTEHGLGRRWWAATARATEPRCGVRELIELLREGGLH